jgi:hypothetical protein
VRDLNPRRMAGEVADENLEREAPGLLSERAGGWCNNGNPLSCSDKGFPGWQGEAGLLILLFFPGTLAHLARNFFLVVARLARCRQDFPFPFAFGT